LFFSEKKVLAKKPTANEHRQQRTTTTTTNIFVYTLLHFFENYFSRTKRLKKA